MQEGEDRTGQGRESEGLPEHSTLCESPNKSCCAMSCNGGGEGSKGPE